MKATGYILQASLIILWWVGLSLSADFFQAFQFPSIGPQAFNAFFLPDLLLIAMLSILRAYWPEKALEYVILGGFAYGTLYCINASFLTKGGILPSTLMTLGLCFNLFLVFQDKIFRESSSSSIWLNGIKTFIQVVGVWSITLVLFPWILLEAFQQSKIPEPNIYFTIGVTLFALFSILGLRSAFIMVLKGNGNPLPLDQTNQLVIEGPYRYVRNPMAIAGIGQGVSVSIIFQSLPIFGYALLGAIFWQLVIRPIEEHNMKKRFGQAYENYKKEVSCWIPTLKLFKKKK